MGIVAGSSFGRTSQLNSSLTMLSTLRKTQQALQQAQNEIATGKKVNKPSDAPADTAAIQVLHAALEERDQWDRNLDHAAGLLDNTDVALADVSELLLEAKSIASSQVGIGSDATTRRAEASVIDGQMTALLEIINRQFSGVPVFGGNSTGIDDEVFVPFLGGIRYVGGDDSLGTKVGFNNPIGMNATGNDAFGALSTRVIGKIDLDPDLTANTRLKDVNGAQALGVRLGQVTVRVNGVGTTVNLAGSETAGDIETRINNAIVALDPAAGALSVNGDGYELTANAGHTIEIEDLGDGQAAKDLGIEISAASATTTGGDVDARLTNLTSLADLGASIDFAGGLKITQGATTKIADFTSAQTIQDMKNEIDRLSMGLRLSINDDGNTISLITEVSGLELSIGENAGGTTAGDLGIRTFGLQTKLDDFQFGRRGVNPQVGQDDFTIELHNGASFNVNVDTAETVADVISLIQSQAAAAGLTVGSPGDAGTDFNMGLALDGNGFRMEDNTAGAGGFRVVQLGESLAATDLGIYADAGTGTTIQGDDLAKVRVESVFTHLMNLRESLVNDDSVGITFAGSRIEEDIELVARVRADVGVRAQRVAQQQERSSEMRIAENILLSNLQDADLTESITRYTQLTQQLQASLQVGSNLLQTSLLDFLR